LLGAALPLGTNTGNRRHESGGKEEPAAARRAAAFVAAAPVASAFMDVERLLEDLQAEDWEIASRAAAALRDVPGEQVTDRLVAALDAHDTAITDAAAESLILRNEPGTADRLWTALSTLTEDITDQIWSVVDDLADQPVSRELDRRYEQQS
jgi:HEAT repeat protein